MGEEARPTGVFVASALGFARVGTIKGTVAIIKACAHRHVATIHGMDR